MSKPSIRERNFRLYRAILAYHAILLKQSNKVKIRQPKYIQRAVSAHIGNMQSTPGHRLHQEIERAAKAMVVSGELDDLTRPQLTLYATASDESQRAFVVLDASNTFFSVEPAHDSALPTVLWAEETFVGLEAISALVQTLVQIDSGIDRLLKGREQLRFTAPDLALTRAMSLALEHNHAQGQNVMEQIESGDAAQKPTVSY